MAIVSLDCKNISTADKLDESELVLLYTVVQCMTQTLNVCECV